MEATVKKEVLNYLRDAVRSVHISDDTGFQETLRECRSILEMSDQELADSLLVSRPTISRWVRGKNLPHRAMRQPIIDWVARQAERRLRALEFV